MQYRTPNVLQYRDTTCEAKLTGETSMEVLSRLKNEQPNNEYETLFRKQIKPVNCRNTFDGNFAFNYQVRIITIFRPTAQQGSMTYITTMKAYMGLSFSIHT